MTPPATMAALPVDILSDILSRLPVKTLLRFRFVSKEFRSSIDNPNFINCHLQYQTFKYPKLIFKRWGDDFRLALLDLDLADNYICVEMSFKKIEGNRIILEENCRVNQELTLENRFEPPFELVLVNPEHAIRVEVIGSCNGLLALCRFGPGVLDIFMWNMSSKKHKSLPKCDFIEDSYINYRSFVGGFGYDATNDDYKLILVHEVNRVVVYSLKAHCWRRIKNCPHSFYLYEWGVLVKDTLNWQGRWVPQDHKHHLFGFNLKDELFYE